MNLVLNGKKFSFLGDILKNNNNKALITHFSPFPKIMEITGNISC